MAQAQSPEVDSPRSGSTRPELPRFVRAPALGCLLCGLVYPLTVLVILLGNLFLGWSGSENPVLSAILTTYIYFEWPFIVLAIILGRMARQRPNPWRHLATGGMALGYLSALVILGAAAAVTLIALISPY